MRYATVALAAVCSLLVAAAAMRAVASRGGETTAFSAQGCSSAPRLAADASFTTPLGVNASGLGQLATATEVFGHMPVIRVYYATAIPGPQEWSTGVLGRSNSSVVLSFDPAPSDIISGADDAALAQFFDAAPTGHAIYYSYYAEPESYIRKGQFTLAQYKQAWAHIVAIADAAHNPDLHSTLILQGQDAFPGDEYNFRNYLPAGGIIAALGWDAYPDGTVEDQNPQPTPPAQFMGPDVAASRSVGLPFGFAEFALGTQNDRPQWLAEVANYLTSNGALFGTLFDAAGFPWMVLNDSASIQAWRSAVAQSASRHALNPPSAPSKPVPTSAKSSRPTPVPVRSASPTPSPGVHGLVITGLTITPRKLWANGRNHVRIKFWLSQAAHVSICVFNGQGTVVRQVNRPDSPTGWAARSYYGYSQHLRLLPAGHYEIMVIANNGTASATAYRQLTLRRKAG